MRPHFPALQNARFALCLAVISLLASGCPSGSRSRLAEGERPTEPESSALASAGSETACEVRYNGPVAIVPVRTRQAFARARSERPATAVVYETDDTAIYDDGRVVTTNLAGVGEHLSMIGWAENPMRILGASAASGVRTSGSDWRSAGSNGKTTSRRRRG